MSDRPRVLVVEVDPEKAAGRIRLLAWGGLEPELARSTGDALAGLVHGDYEVVLMDPACEDVDTDRILASAPRTLPVIAVSFDDRRASLLGAFRRGFTDWLDEPLSAEAVLEALERSHSHRATAGAKVAAEEPLAVPLPPSIGSPGPLRDEAPNTVRDIAQMVRDGSIVLPQMPEVVLRLRALLRAPDVEVADVVGVLERDPGMVARVVASANTAAVAARSPIRDVRGALVRLGTRRVRSLVETAAVRDMFGTPTGGVGEALQHAWRAHVTSACVARAVAEGTGILDPEEAYLMTLFRDVGELFLVGVMGDLGSGGLGAQEIAMIDGWHPRFGAALLAKWGMGRRFRVVAQNHHQARFVGEPGDIQCLHLVHVAGHLTAHLVQTLDGSVPAGPDLAESYRALSLTGREVEALVARMPELYQEAVGLAA